MKQIFISKSLKTQTHSLYPFYYSNRPKLSESVVLESSVKAIQGCQIGSFGLV